MEIFKCEFCGRELEYKNKFTISGHKAKCIKFQDFINNKLTKEILLELYINKKMSTTEIADKYQISFGNVIYRLRKFNIPIRSLKEVANMPEVRNKYKQTNLDRTGSEHNFCKEHPSRKEWEKRLLDEEGITNVFQRESVKEEIRKTNLEVYGFEVAAKSDIVKNKTKETEKIKYYPLGVTHHTQLDSVKQKANGTIDKNPSAFASKMMMNRKTYTILHQSIVDFLKSKNCEIYIEYTLKEGKRRFRFDIFVINTHKLIEVNGDFFHANPSKYKEDDILFRGTKREKTAKEIWKHDKEKLDYAKSFGYEVLDIWESEIEKDLEKTHLKIINFINK